MTAYVEESDFGIGMHRNKYMKFLKEIYVYSCILIQNTYMHMCIQLKS